MPLLLMGQSPERPVPCTSCSAASMALLLPLELMWLPLLWVVLAAAQVLPPLQSCLRQERFCLTPPVNP